VGNSHSQRELSRNLDKEAKIQAIKMETLIEKMIFSQFPPFTLYSFLRTILTSIDFLFQLCLTTEVCLARAVTMSQIVHPYIQGIIQHPVKVRDPNTTMRNVKIEAITPFHFPNH
jgi:hypothetical protein